MFVRHHPLQIIMTAAQNSLSIIVIACVFFLTIGTTQAQAQTVGCVIASNDGSNGFRTDEITRCRINVANGNATFVMKQRERSRSYTSRQAFSPQHQQIAQYWLQRAGQLQFQSRYNRANFDVRAFLEAATRATDGFTLVRTKRSGAQALNIVYITEGIYRSIDFDGINVGEVPSGFLTTGN